MGTRRRVADLWGFCGASQEPLGLPDQPTWPPRYSDLWVLVITLRITQSYRASLPRFTVDRKINSLNEA